MGEDEMGGAGAMSRKGFGRHSQRADCSGQRRGKGRFTPLVPAGCGDILAATMQNTLMTAERDYEYNMRRVSDRTLELAKLAGRAPHQISQLDYERAKREIACEAPTGGT